MYPYVWSLKGRDSSGIGHTLVFHGSFSLPIYRNTAPKEGFNVVRIWTGRGLRPELPMVSYDLLQKKGFGVMVWPEPSQKMIILGQSIRDGKLGIISAQQKPDQVSGRARVLSDLSLQGYEDDEFSVFAAFAADHKKSSNSASSWARAVELVDSSKSDSLWNLTHLIATLDPEDRDNPELRAVAAEREKSERTVARRLCFSMIAWLAGDLDQEVKMKTLASQVAEWPVNFAQETMSLSEMPVGSDLAIARHVDNPQRALAILKAAASARTDEARLFCLSNLGRFQDSYRPLLLKMLKDKRVIADTPSINKLCETLAQWMPHKVKPLESVSLQEKALGWIRILEKR